MDGWMDGRTNRGRDDRQIIYIYMYTERNVCTYVHTYIQGGREGLFVQVPDMTTGTHSPS